MLISNTIYVYDIKQLRIFTHIYFNYLSFPKDALEILKCDFFLHLLPNKNPGSLIFRVKKCRLLFERGQ
jgi:Secreted/periplasmic Zn-dependent peptidases, insulinase-like